MPTGEDADRQIGILILPWGLMAILTIPMAIVGLFARLWIWQPTFRGDVGYYAAALPALTSDAPLYDRAALPLIGIRIPWVLARMRRGGREALRDDENVRATRAAPPPA